MFGDEGPVRGGGGNGEAPVEEGRARALYRPSSLDRQIRLKTLPSPLRWRAITINLHAEITGKEIFRHL